MVVFQENVDTPTLNTDIIAQVSRNNGTTLSTVTLADEVMSQEVLDKEYLQEQLIYQVNHQAQI